MIRSETSTQGGGKTYPCNTCVCIQATRPDPASLCPQRNEKKCAANLSASKTSDTETLSQSPLMAAFDCGDLPSSPPITDAAPHHRDTGTPFSPPFATQILKLLSNSLSFFSRCPLRNTQVTVASTASFRDGVCEAMNRFSYSLKPFHFTEVISLKSADCKNCKPPVPHI